MLIKNWGQGIIGAAWATIIAQLISLVFLLTTMFTISKRNKSFIAPKLSLPKISDIAKFGASIMPLAIG